ncbi:MAG: enoyl-CoA hydratase/isomerase family protein [Cytophagaceae bacterium]
MSGVKIISHNKGIEIRLSEPQKYNALHPTLIKELTEAFLSASENESIEFILFTAEGKGFCAGLDLQWADSIDPSTTQTIVEELFNPLAKSIYHNKKFVVCHLTGVASGAGASLVLCCDYIIGDANASMHFPFISLGLQPDTGMSYLLKEKVGSTEAMNLLLHSAKLSAKDLMNKKLIHELIEESTSFESTNERWSKYPQSSLSLLKHSIKSNLDFDSSLSQEAIHQQKSMMNGFYKKALAVFFNKK